MEDIVKVASYVCARYEKEFGCPIDEMKLHKLLYLIQRESLIQTDEPMFAERFQAWRYGPVMVEVRGLYKTGELNTPIDCQAAAKYKSVFDKVFSAYAAKDSWSLSSLTHCEYSYKKARGGKLRKYDDCSSCIDTDDIRKDAARIKLRRFVYDEILPQHS